MAAQSNGAFAPIVFSFQSVDVRTFVDDQGNPWFCAKDVCKVLGYANDSKTIKDHCREAGVTKRYLRSGNQNREFAFISEGNLYRLITRSKKPEAENFEEMVMDEILPTIRKTGSYQHKPVSLPAIQAEQIAKQIEEQLLKSLPTAYPRIQPLTWTRSDQLNFDAAWQIIKELKEWANTLPEELRSPLLGALNQLSTNLVAGLTRVDESIRDINNGLFHLNNWMGTKGRVGNVG
jgi:prophage antirepressor-like protein